MNINVCHDYWLLMLVNYEGLKQVQCSNWPQYGDKQVKQVKSKLAKNVLESKPKIELFFVASMIGKNLLDTSYSFLSLKYKSDWLRAYA